MLIRNCDIHKIGFLSLYFTTKTFQLISLFACDIFLLNCQIDWHWSLWYLSIYYLYSWYLYIWSYGCIVRRCSLPFMFNHESLSSPTKKYGIQISISARFLLSISLDLFIIRDQDIDLTKQQMLFIFSLQKDGWRILILLPDVILFPRVFEGSASFERFQAKAYSFITCAELVITNATRFSFTIVIFELLICRQKLTEHFWMYFTSRFCD